MIGRRSLAVTSLLLVAAAAAPGRADDPVSSSVRFNREIIRIFDRKCLACHARDTIGMPLSTYREVRPWSRAIREEIIEQRMPPWSAARGYTRLQNEMSLTPRELSTILTWLDGGLPKGDDDDLPDPHRHAPPAEPGGQVVRLPAQPVPGDFEDAIRRLDAGITAPQRLRRVVIHPGKRRLLRAAFAFVVPPSGPPLLAGSWTPTQTELALPPDTLMEVPAGARLELELHYRGGERAASDTPSIELFRADAGGQPLTAMALEPRGGGAFKRDEVRLSAAADVWALLPLAQTPGASLEVTARRPDGRVDVLLWIPEARPEWPAPFVLYEPARLGAGTVISVVAGDPADVRVLIAAAPVR